MDRKFKQVMCADCEGYDQRNRWCLFQALTVSSAYRKTTCRFYRRSEDFEYNSKKGKSR